MFSMEGTLVIVVGINSREKCLSPQLFLLLVFTVHASFFSFLFYTSSLNYHPSGKVLRFLHLFQSHYSTVGWEQCIKGLAPWNIFLIALGHPFHLGNYRKSPKLILAVTLWTMKTSKGISHWHGWHKSKESATVRKHNGMCMSWTHENNILWLSFF